jgi:hypothetical protein
VLSADRSDSMALVAPARSNTLMEEVQNNTSVILLFEAGERSFLLSGDAQIENWSYTSNAAKKDKKRRAKLESVNDYKVGHHGSLNANPKSLWEWFTHKSVDENDADRLHTVVSTMTGQHGSTVRGTEVPRKSLVEELEAKSTFFTTQRLTRQKEFFHDEEFVL